MPLLAIFATLAGCAGCAGFANRRKPDADARTAAARPSRAPFARTAAAALSALAALTVPAAAYAAITVTDDSGTTVTLAAPATRVITLSPHATELMYAAGGGPKVVGTVAYSDYPPQAKTVPRVGNNRALDLERIAALRPDLIVVWWHGNAQQQIDRLRDLHIPLFFSDPHRLDDVATNLTRLGALLGTPSAAQAAAAAYRRDIAQLRARYSARPPVSVFYQVWDQPLMTINGSQMISDVITLCGGRNVFAALRPIVPTISTEAVLAANPEVIVTASPGATAPDRPLPGLDRWRAWPELTAAARGNLFAIDGDLLSRPAPRIAQGAALLCQDLETARSRRPTAAAH
jgi:iron complex transport system substrate-binding protein